MGAGAKGSDYNIHYYLLVTVSFFVCAFVGYTTSSGVDAALYMQLAILKPKRCNKTGTEFTNIDRHRSPT